MISQNKKPAFQQVNGCLFKSPQPTALIRVPKSALLRIKLKKRKSIVPTAGRKGRKIDEWLDAVYYWNIKKED
jgi:hypothetical protein